MLLEVYDTNKQVSDLLNIWPPCTQMWQGHLRFQKHKLFELSTQTNRNTFEEKTIKLSEIQPLASKQILASNIHNWKFKFTLEMNFIILCFVAIFSLNSWQRENIEAYFLSQWKIQLQKKRNWILYILLLERCNQKKRVNDFLSYLLPDTHPENWLFHLSQCHQLHVSVWLKKEADKYPKHKTLKAAEISTPYRDKEGKFLKNLWCRIGERV